MIEDGVFVKVVAENNLSLIFFKQFRLKLFINNIIIKFAISETLLALVEQKWRFWTMYGGRVRIL